MAVRKVSRRKLTKHQLGDLRERIEVGDNILRPAGFGKSGMRRTFVLEGEVWAKVETVTSVSSGEVIFNGVNIATNASHVFVMRYREGFTTEKWIRWRGQAYEVDKVMEPEERNQYTVVFAYFEGTQTKLANT